MCLSVLIHQLCCAKKHTVPENHYQSKTVVIPESNSNNDRAMKNNPLKNTSTKKVCKEMIKLCSNGLIL